MHNEMIFQMWAPEDARWSPWVKPVLFACMPFPSPEWLNVPEFIDVSWAPAPSENVAFVIDLPGPTGVAVGLDLAALGYRPVPLYNAIPMPFYTPEPDEIVPAEPLVKVEPIMAALWHGRERLLERPLPADAPPAFLLDWNRDGAGLHPFPGSFDNRSVSFTTDFPSATFLLSHGIQRAVLVQPAGEQPRTDLTHTLRRWQEAGIDILLKRLDVADAPKPCVVQKPSWFGWAWQRALITFGFRRADSGGFGGWVPEPSSG